MLLVSFSSQNTSMLKIPPFTATCKIVATVGFWGFMLHSGHLAQLIALKTDHRAKWTTTRIAGRCEPAEVAKATTCLYPARFSTPEFTLEFVSKIPFLFIPTNRPQRVLLVHGATTRSRSFLRTQCRTFGDKVHPQLAIFSGGRSRMK